MVLKDFFGIFEANDDDEEQLLVPVGDFLSEQYVPQEPDTSALNCSGRVGGTEDGLEAFLEKETETFSERLLQLIAEKKVEIPELCKRSAIDRRHFSKMKNNVNYRPTKNTAVALAIGLRLSFEETEDLLRHAGYVLTKSSKADLIVEYCLRNRIYSMDRVNDLLFRYNEAILGE